MIMSERENFNKLIQLLSGGGTLVLRQLLEKYSAPLRFVDYVYRNQATVLGLKFFENQRQLVVTREIDKMDITLLGKLLTGLFKDKMTVMERNLVGNIKEERDSFMHSDILKEAKIEEQVFNRRWKIISSILLDIAVEIGSNEFNTDVEKFIKETEESVPHGNEIHDILIKWCESNEKLAEKVSTLEMNVQEIKGEQSKKISNDQEVVQSEIKSCPRNQNGK